MNRYSFLPDHHSGLHIAHTANMPKPTRQTVFNQRLSGVDSAASSSNILIPSLSKARLDLNPTACGDLSPTVLGTCELVHTEAKIFADRPWIEFSGTPVIFGTLCSAQQTRCVGFTRATSDPRDAWFAAIFCSLVLS